MKIINPKIFSLSGLLFLGLIFNLSAQERFTLKGEINGQDIDGKTEARVIVCDNFNSINLLNHVAYGSEKTITYKTETNGLSGHIFYPSLAGEGNHLITIIYAGQQTVSLTFEIPHISAGGFLGVCRTKKIQKLYTEDVYPKLDGKGKWSFLNENRKDDSQYDKYINQTTGELDVSQIPYGFYTLKYEYGSCYDTRGIEIGGVNVFAGGNIIVCKNPPDSKLVVDLLTHEGVAVPEIDGDPIGPNTPYEWYWESKELSNYINGSSLNLTNVTAGTYEIDLVVNTSGETTKCTDRDTRKIIIEGIPEKPKVQGDERCGPGEVVMRVLEPLEGLVYEWYYESDNEVGKYTGFSGVEFKTKIEEYTSFYVIAVSKGGCESEPAEVSGIVNYPPPTPEISLFPESICVGESITFNAGYFEGPAAPTEIKFVYNWYWDAEKQNPIKEASGPEYTHTFSTTDQNVIYVEVIDPETKCVSGLGKAGFSVNPIPNKPEVDDVSICEPGEVLLKVNNPQDDVLYYWYANYDPKGENDPITEPSTKPELAIKVETSGKYYVIVKSRAGCESSVEEIQVNVTGKPEKPIVQGDERCGPGEVLLKISELSDGFTYNWYEGEVGETSVHTGTEFKVALTTTTKYFVTANLNGKCVSDPAEVFGIINFPPLTPEILLSKESICEGESITFNVGFIENTSAPSIEGYTYNWYWDAEKQNPIKEISGSEYTHTFSTTDQNVIYVEAVDPETNCVSGLAEADFNVNPIPAKPEVDNVSICVAGKVELSVKNPEKEVSYYWYKTYNKEGENEPIGDPSPNILVDVESTSKYYVVGILDESCESEVEEVEVIITDKPDAPQIEDQSICGPGKILLMPLVSQEESKPVFRFYPGENTDHIHEGDFYEPEIKETTSYWVTRIIDGACESEPTKVTITILDEVQTPLVDGFVNCGPLSSYKLEVKNPVDGLQYLWYQNEKDPKEKSIGQGTSFLLEGIDATRVVWVEASNNNDCVGERVSVEVTILEKPGIPEIADGVSCGPGQVKLAIKNPDENLTYNWYKALEDNEPVSTGNSYTTDELSTNTKFYVVAQSFYGEGEIECTSDAAEVEVKILESGDIGIGDDIQLCFDAPGYDLFQDLNIEGGTFSGPGVEDGSLFNPKTAGFGNHEITFKYASTDGCSFIGTRIIEVIYPLNASEDLLTQTELVICSNEEFIDLTTLEKKPGGEWSGDGVELGKFYPEKVEGESVSLEYFIKENGCEYRVKVSIRVININLESPELSVNKPEFCEGDMVKISVTNLDESLRYVWYNENSDSVGTGASFEFMASKTAVITCEAKNSLDCGSDQSSITVNVFAFPEEIIVSSNAINQHEFVQFSLDSTANTTYLWDFKTTETSTQRSPGYYFHEGGEFNVVVYMENTMLGCKDSLTTLIKVDLDQEDFVTGLDDELIPSEKNEGISISSYPQPFNNFIRLFLKSERSANAEIAVINTEGKIIENRKLEILRGEQDFNLETEMYPSGLYLIKIILPDYQKVIKALKQ